MKRIDTPDVVLVQRFNRGVYVIRQQNYVMRHTMYTMNGQGLVTLWPVYSTKETKWSLTQEEVGQLMGGN